MTVQRVVLHAVAIATLGAMCAAQSSTPSGNTGTDTTTQHQSMQQQSGSQQSGTQQQPGMQQQQSVNPQGQSTSSQQQTGTHRVQSGKSSMGRSTVILKDTGARRGKSPDHLFITKAAQGGLAEVELGNLAQRKAKSDDVKDFGGKMAVDHSQANSELKQVAELKGIKVPSSMSAKDKQTKKLLSAKRGGLFDKAYMRDMVKDHEKDVAEFRKEAENGKDPEVKAFAQKTLPTLEQHLAQAKEVAQKVGAGNSSQAMGSNTQQKPESMSKPGASQVHPY